MMPFTMVADAIAERVALRWPDRTIYRDVCPADFERPSFFLSTEEARIAREMLLLEVSAIFLLEIFDEKDDFYVSSSERLMEVQTQVLSLFSLGGLHIAETGRHVTVSAQALGREPDVTAVRLSVNWLDEDDEPDAVEDFMEDFNFTGGAVVEPARGPDTQEGSD